MYYKLLSTHPKLRWLDSPFAPWVGTLLIFLLLTVGVFSFYPASVLVIFLLGIVAVMGTAIMFERWYALFSFILVSILAYLAGADEILGHETFIYRYLTFSVTSFLLCLLVVKFKQADSAAATRKRQLEIIYNSLSDVVMTLNEKAVIVFVSPQATELLGYTPEELVGTRLHDIMPTEYRDKCSTGFFRYIDTGKKTLDWKGFAVKILKKNKTEIDVEISFGEYFDNNRRYFSAILRDISLRKRYEQEILQNMERYKAFIENSEESIWMIEYVIPINTKAMISAQVDAFFMGTIREANPKTLELYGLKKEQFIGQPVAAVIPRTQEAEDVLTKFIKDNYSLQNYETEAVDAKGNTKWTVTSFKGVVFNNLVQRAWCVQKDITDRKVQQARLEQAKTDLEIANVQKDRFLANLSHELRTPLVSILGYSSLLMEAKLDPQLKGMIETVHKNAKYQVQLIQDLLDVSRIISGKIELDKSLFSISELAQDAVNTFLPQANEKGLKIKLFCEEKEFYGDRKRISQILLNLLSNAVKYTEKGEVEVGAKICNGHFKLCVSDTGIGIKSEDFPLLFQPFKQIDSSSTKTKQGLGLGLSIVKTLAELHDGTVHVESEYGKGSEFTVYLPVIAHEHIEEIKKSKPTKSLENVRILVVEDDVDSASFLEYLYETKKAVVDVAHSAKEARELIAKSKYNLYIFDIAMPEEDGLSLIRSVRMKGDKTKAVALTAFGDLNYEKEAIEAGFDMFLKKPSPLNELLSVVNILD